MLDKKNPVHFGLIGCGIISPQHFESIGALDGAKLAAVCDNKPQRAEQAGSKYGVPCHLDYRELLQIPEIDVVSICTPHGLHVPMGIDALNAGKHIIMEKPIGIAVAEVDRLIAAARQNERKIFPVLQVRHNPTIRMLKELIDGHKLGKLHHAALVMRWFRPQSYYDKSDWHGRKASEGGFLLSQGIHYIDIMRHLFGTPSHAYANLGTVAHKIEIEDHVAGVVTFKRGMTATIEMSLATYPRNLECSITVLGENGTVEINGSALNEIGHWEVEGVPRPDIVSGNGPNVYVGGMYQGSCPNHIYIYQDALSHLEDPDHPYIDEWEARSSLVLAESLYRSAEKGDRIVIDEAPALPERNHAIR
jgi:predicted dehydrogenase